MIKYIWWEEGKGTNQAAFFSARLRSRLRIGADVAVPRVAVVAILALVLVEHPAPIGVERDRRTFGRAASRRAVAEPEFYLRWVLNDGRASLLPGSQARQG